VNVITKSGTNEVRGSLFHYQRLAGLTSKTSDGNSLQNFHREQFGGTVGGPVVKDKAFYFLALEGVRENLQRPNLSAAIGTPCPVNAPTLTIGNIRSLPRLTERRAFFVWRRGGKTSGRGEAVTAAPLDKKRSAFSGHAPDAARSPATASSA
jgi:hypothetical protein